MRKESENKRFEQQNEYYQIDKMRQTSNLNLDLHNIIKNQKKGVSIQMKKKIIADKSNFSD